MAKKQTEFRVTPEQVKAAIKGKPTFTKLPSKKKIVCELTLQNGFTVIGVSSVVDLRNHVEKIGRQVALENATNEVWKFLGYETQTRLAESLKPAPKKAVTTAASRKLGASLARTPRAAKPVATAAPFPSGKRSTVKRVPRTTKPAAAPAPTDDTL